MVRFVGLACSGFAMTAWVTLAAVSLGSAPARAIVSDRSVGVPQCCVASPDVQKAQAVRRAARPGVGVRGAGAGARGPGVRHGTPANRGGPVNRVGRH